jgi:hypothetical protein
MRERRPTGTIVKKEGKTKKKKENHQNTPSNSIYFRVIRITFTFAFVVLNLLEHMGGKPQMR